MIDPKELLRRPVTALVLLLSVLTTLAFWSGWDIRPLVLTSRWPLEPWRVLTSTFPHVNVFHLAFNCVWTAVFGMAIERHYGSARTALLIVLLAAGSGLSEYALFRGGVGLSGVGYGLFGFLWMLRRQGHPLGQVVDGPTARLFIGWFFLCVVLTLTGTWRIANVAHGAGAGFGALAGLGLAPGRRWIWALGGGLLALAGLAAGPLRGAVNVGTYRLGAADASIEQSAHWHA